ncbi:MAG: DUF2271 domain-containing protein [Prolixibacteraceae bacterium]|nr:DUF2271 domain-containing protein [Prolixibacteraceae bacterium]
MARRVLMVLCIVFVSVLAVNAQYLQVDFNTTTIEGGEYSPRHILAVWVEDTNGNFVNTVIVYAEERKSKLGKWNAASGGYKADAVTGATLSNNDQYHSVEWDLKNFAGQTVQNGTYTLCMEITSDDFTGPYREVEFVLDGNDFTLNPADGSNYSNISILFENEATSNQSIDYNDKYLNIYPNPVRDELIVKLLAERKSQATLKLLNVEGKVVGMFEADVNEGVNELNADDLVRDISPGYYSLSVETDHYKVAKKILVN